MGHKIDFPKKYDLTNPNPNHKEKKKKGSSLSSKVLVHYIGDNMRDICPRMATYRPSVSFNTPRRKSHSKNHTQASIDDIFNIPIIIRLRRLSCFVCCWPCGPSLTARIGLLLERSCGWRYPLRAKRKAKDSSAATLQKQKHCDSPRFDRLLKQGYGCLD